MQFRRLPLYFVVSCSRSMGPDALYAVMEGLQSLKQTCMQNPVAIETLHVSVIAAGSDAWQKDPLAPIDRLDIPFLFPEGAGELALGAACTIANNCIEREVTPKSPGIPGDYRPLIVMCVNHSPSDNWVEPAKELLGRTSPPIGGCLTLLLGPDANEEDFRHVAGMNPVSPRDVTPGMWTQVFRWLDQ